MLGGDLLALPVHAGGLAVVDLHAIHADVALAGAGVAGVDAGQGDEAAAVVGPALEDGEVVEVEVVAEDDFLAGGVFGADGFGEGAGECAELGQHLELVEEALGGGFMLRRPLMRSAISSRWLTPRDMAMRRSQPNWLMRTLWPGWPLMFSKSRAGPPGA